MSFTSIYHKKLLEQTNTFEDINNIEKTQEYLYLEELKETDIITFNKIIGLKESDEDYKKEKENKYKLEIETKNLIEYNKVKDIRNIDSLLLLFNISRKKIYESIFTYSHEHNININDMILINIDNFIQNGTYLPDFIIEKTLSFILNKLIIIIDENEHVNIFYPNGENKYFFSLYSNILCSLLEENILSNLLNEKESIPELFLLNKNNYFKYSYTDYINKRICKICKNENNHKSHIIIPCFHTLCKECYNSWFLIYMKKTCPMCRIDIKYINTIDSEENISINCKELNIIRTKLPDKMFD